MSEEAALTVPGARVMASSRRLPSLVRMSATLDHMTGRFAILAPEAEKLLIILADHGGWLSLVRLDALRHPLDDAIAFVPALIAHGLARHDRRMKAVRITANGRAHAESVRR